MAKLPFFSVIIPTHNRPVQLTHCLAALEAQEYPVQRFEVIVVDDGSRMPLADWVAPCRRPYQVKLLTQARGGPAAARNAGAAAAQGEFLAFTDDDCLPAPGWLRALALRFLGSRHQAFGGRTINSLPDNPFAVTSHLIQDMVYAHYNADPHQARFFATNNLALPAGAFHRLGGFDPTFATSEDRDLCDRCLHHGLGLAYAPNAVVYHAHRLTGPGFWWQHFNYGRGAFRFHQARVHRGSGPFRPEARFYQTYLRLMLQKIIQVRDRPSLMLAALLIWWQVANTAGFFGEWLEQLWRKAPRGEKSPKAVSERIWG